MTVRRLSLRALLPMGALAAASLLLLAACAGEPEHVEAVAPQVETKAVPERPVPEIMEVAAPGGRWVVTGAFPVGAVADMASAPRGQTIPLDEALAGEPGGGICRYPHYRTRTATLGSLLGGGEGVAFARSVTGLDVVCDGRILSTFVTMDDGSLHTRYGGWLLRLERAGTAAVAIPALLPPTIALQGAGPVPSHLVYLASYNTEAGAKKGWGVLVAGSPTLARLSPVTRSVTLPGKGHFVRLFAAAHDAAEAQHICTEVKKAVADCGAAGREK
jgi:hypothetical protein